MTEAPESPETMSVLSDGEADHVLSKAASAEDPDSPLVGNVQEQVQEDVQMQEEVFEQEVQAVSSGKPEACAGCAICCAA